MFLKILAILYFLILYYYVEPIPYKVEPIYLFDTSSLNANFQYKLT